MNEESKYYQEYYDFILDEKEPSSTSKKTIFRIIDDLRDRKGLRHEFESMDGDIQDEIIDTWIGIVEEDRQ